VLQPDFAFQKIIVYSFFNRADVHCPSVRRCRETARKNLMTGSEHPALEGEVLGSGIPDPEAREITPGWVTRNRDLILKGRSVARSLVIAAPPPARLVFAAASVVADGLLLAEDSRRGLIDRKTACVRAGGLVLDGAALIAASRFAPAMMVRNRGKLSAARSVLNRLNQNRGV
jgi:hypothetical protein